ncbi:MAG: carbohydrate ABC transporter permease, partial [Oscillospiraceae bacterium]
MKTINKKSGNILATVVLSFCALFVALPIYLTIVTAFKTQSESAKNFFSLPETFYLENFQKVLFSEGYGQYV